jgi:hypothetical protein
LEEERTVKHVPHQEEVHVTMALAASSNAGIYLFRWGNIVPLIP